MDIAEKVAQHFKRLRELGIPPEVATALTLEYQNALVYQESKLLELAVNAKQQA